MDSMKLISHVCTMEFSANLFLYAGLVGSSATNHKNLLI